MIICKPLSCFAVHSLRNVTRQLTRLLILEDGARSSWQRRNWRACIRYTNNAIFRDKRPNLIKNVALAGFSKDPKCATVHQRTLSTSPPNRASRRKSRQKMEFAWSLFPLTQARSNAAFWCYHLRDMRNRLFTHLVQSPLTHHQPLLLSPHHPPCPHGLFACKNGHEWLKKRPSCIKWIWYEGAPFSGYDSGWKTK